jgi:hypothetical protein
LETRRLKGVFGERFEEELPFGWLPFLKGGLFGGEGGRWCGLGRAVCSGGRGWRAKTIYAVLREIVSRRRESVMPLPEMKVGPSEPSCRGRLQTAISCFGQKPRWCCVMKARKRRAV